MKKIFFMALMAVMSISASAQIEQGLRFGVQGFGGINSIGEDGAKTAVTYGTGVVAEYNFSENFYLGSGLNFQNKGWKADWLDGTANVYYLTLPIHLGGRVSIGDNSYFHFQAGPQLGFGVAGSDIEIYEVGTAKYSDWGKRFEAGVGAKVGVEFNKLQVNVSGNYGITECMDGAGHNLDFAVGVAYMF